MSERTSNIQKIRKLISFEENSFYFVQIIKRRKDFGNSDMEKGERVIKSYYIDSFESYDKLVPMMVDLADQNNARVYINLNKRSYEKVCVDMIKYLADALSNKQYHSARTAFDKIAGKNRADKQKKWVIDVDIKSKSLSEEIEYYIDNEKPEGKKCLGILDTPNGYHMIVKPFDPREFSKKYPDCEIKKDNPTILYCPDMEFYVTSKNKK
ncbi:hypothetical protein KY334_06560 [Candidatus Woesearchaeota archaeon]|nr:hypothetical protein [Candidatus Woesearchaeota archaeon]